jgi:hypothetical protein
MNQHICIGYDQVLLSMYASMVSFGDQVLLSMYAMVRFCYL